jgi:integrase
MPRGIHKLTDTGIRAEKVAGRHSDGGGLYLNVTASGTKSWLFMWVREGRRREMGLGAYPAVGLSKARTKAVELRAAVEAGRDPIAEKKQAPEPTFKKCAEDYIDANKADWSNAKHEYQWRQTLGAPCAFLLEKRVSQITVDDIARVLKPIWTTKPETASRLRGRIERVLNYAKTMGWRQGENPAAWRGNLSNILPKPPAKRTRGRQPALPYSEVPEFFAQLQLHPGLSARALELTILTAARSGEMLGARWDEFDLAGKLWTVPPDRMKTREVHEVPLSDMAVAILTTLSETATSQFVFPSMTKPEKQPLSNMVMLMLLRRMKRTSISVHGFRSSFRDWCGDQTSFPREVAEAALAHKVGNDVEQAYRRGTALAKRAKLMQAWANYCYAPAKSNVLPFAGTRSPAA